MLGYNVPLNSENNALHLFQFSALPLLEFFKIFLDWYTPSQTQWDNPLHGVINQLSQSISNQQGIHFPFRDNANSCDILTCLKSFELAVGNDYFTSAWESPNKVGAGQYNGFGPIKGYSEMSSRNEMIGNSDTGVNLYNTSGGSATAMISLSEFGLHLLDKFQQFITRNNLAGSRAVERILARFGVRVPDARMRVAEYIGSNSSSLDIMQVVNQGGDIQNLGALAGRAIASSTDGTFEYDVKEHTIFFNVCPLF